jgi:hypothetical protein
MPDDNAWSEPHGTHGSSHIARVLQQAVRAFGFLGIAATSEVEPEKCASSC